MSTVNPIYMFEPGLILTVSLNKSIFPPPLLVYVYINTLCVFNEDAFGSASAHDLYY